MPGASERYRDRERKRRPVPTVLPFVSVLQKAKREHRERTLGERTPVVKLSISQRKTRRALLLG
jgi:hypothetical protein